MTIPRDGSSVNSRKLQARPESLWFIANKLSLNIAKTNVMVISRKQIVNNPIVSINSINIERVYNTTFLGVHIDFNWIGMATLRA